MFFLSMFPCGFLCLSLLFKSYWSYLVLHFGGCERSRGDKRVAITCVGTTSRAAQPSPWSVCRTSPVLPKTVSLQVSWSEVRMAKTIQKQLLQRQKTPKNLPTGTLAGCLENLLRICTTKSSKSPKYLSWLKHFVVHVVALSMNLQNRDRPAQDSEMIKGDFPKAA